MNITLRESSFWLKTQDFIPREIIIQERGYSISYTILGYFPYHTARIRQRLHRDLLMLPRIFVVNLEKNLQISHVFDNKAVYICQADSGFGEIFQWAVWLADEHVIIGRWEEVVGYDGKKLKMKHDKPNR